MWYSLFTSKTQDATLLLVVKGEGRLNDLFMHTEDIEGTSEAVCAFSRSYPAVLKERWRRVELAYEDVCLNEVHE